MCHCLYAVIICSKCPCKHHLTVAGCADSKDIKLDALLIISVNYIYESTLNCLKRFAVIVVIEGINDVIVFVDYDALGGGRA